MSYSRCFLHACFIFYSSVNLYNYDDISLTLNRLLANQGVRKLDKDIAVKDLPLKRALGRSNR